MDKKTTGIVAYITWIGWIIAFCAGDKEGAKLHLNQALVIWIGYIVAAVVAYIPLVGWLLSLVLEVFLLVMFIMGIVAAIKGEDKELPIIGGIKILK